MRNYDELKKVVAAKGYQFYSDDLKLNFIWERTNEEITNIFTDYLYVVYLEGGKKKVICIPATTKPGLKGSIDSPITHEGVTGTAIIVPGQYVDAWTFKDTTKEFSSYPYFRQFGKIDYWRDFNKDRTIDRVQFQDDKVFGTHWHRMSNNGTYGSGKINNWSLGCMGAPEPEFKKILPIVRASVEKHGAKFTGTILETKDFGTQPTKEITEEVPNAPQRSYAYTEQSGTVVCTASGGLSVRKGVPSTASSKIRMIEKGASVTYVGYVTDGQSVSGNSKWYKDSDGNYFWSGGVKEGIASSTPSKPTETTQSGFISALETVEVTASSLRVRKQPNTKDKPVTTVQKGQKIRVTGYVENGESVRGNSKWYKSQKGNYIWSGGVKPI